MNDAIVNLRKVKSSWNRNTRTVAAKVLVIKQRQTRQFRKKIISKLVETEFEVETKAIMFNAWKIRTEKEKEKK